MSDALEVFFQVVNDIPGMESELAHEVWNTLQMNGILIGLKEDFQCRPNGEERIYIRGDDVQGRIFCWLCECTYPDVDSWVHHRQMD